MTADTRRLSPYVYLAPALVTMLLFSFIPIGYNLYIALTNFSQDRFLDYSFNGMQNFVELFAGPYAKILLPTILWNIGYALLATVTSAIAGMFLALLLNNHHIIETNVYRGLLIIPWAIPGTLGVLAWKGLLNQSSGAINNWVVAITHALGFDGVGRLPWLVEPNWARASVLLVNLWFSFPYFMMLSLGALQSIPTDVYEAADLDGASAWSRLTKITLPLLVRFTTPLLIGSFAFNFNNFNTAFLVTDGGPPRMESQWAGYTDILISVSYKLTTTVHRYGLAAALGIVLFVIVAVLAGIQMKATRAFEEAD